MRWGGSGSAFRSLDIHKLLFKFTLFKDVVWELRAAEGGYID